MFECVCLPGTGVSVTVSSRGLAGMRTTAGIAVFDFTADEDDEESEGEEESE